MLIWRRDIPKNFRSLVAIGTLSAMVALAPAMRYSTTLGQEPSPTKEQTKEQKPPPVKGSEEKEPVKKSDETGPVKGTKEKEPIKKSEEQQQEGRGEKTEKAPQKKDEKAPIKGNEKVPIRGQEKGTDAAASVKDSTLEGQLVKITGSMLMMTSKGGKEHSLRLMEDAKLTLEGKAFRAADLKPGMIIRVTTLPPDHGRAIRIEVLDLNAGPAANTRLPKEGTPLPRREVERVRTAEDAKEIAHEGQLVKITGNMLMMTSKGGKEHSFRLMEDSKLTLEGKAFRATDLKPGMIIQVTTLPPDHSRASRIEVLDLNAGPAANTRLPKEETPMPRPRPRPQPNEEKSPRKEMPKEGADVEKVVIKGLREDFCACLNQNAANNWIFGKDARINFGASPFTTATPSLAPSPFLTDEGCSTISDASGDLLFYTDGTTVWDKNGIAMPNGTGLMGNSTSTQSALIVPCSCNKYFIFTTDALEHGYVNGLRYSVVDMTSSVEDVISISKNTLLLANSSEKVAGVGDGGGGGGFWVVAHSMDNNSFYAYHILPDGTCTPQPPVISAVGSNYGGVTSRFGQGQMKISPDGKLLAVAGFNTSNSPGPSFVELFKFDTGSGVVSNYSGGTTTSRDTKPARFYGLEFSPNSQSLWATTTQTTSVIYQYPINSGGLGTPNTISPGGDGAVAALQLGPDGKIYIARIGQTSIFVLPNPSAPGGGWVSATDPTNLFPLATESSSQYGLPAVVAGNFSCGPDVAEGCCPGANLVNNGNFEANPIGQDEPPVWPGITSQYAASNSFGPGGTLPGEYNIVNGTQALNICSNWAVADHGTCLAEPGKFMVVNGRTGQPGSSSIWSQTVAVAAGEYKFCAFAKNLPQCCFDVLPKIEVKFSGIGIGTGADIAPTIVNTSGAVPCDWQLISGSVTVPNGTTSLTINILLNEQPPGDGNDLALDDISFQLKPQVNADYVAFTVVPTVPAGGVYHIDAFYPPLLPGSPYHYYWEVCEWVNNTCVNTVTNPPQWWTYTGPGTSGQLNNFPGYDGHNYNSSVTTPGNFLTGITYHITLGVWSDCEGWGASAWEFKFLAGMAKAEVTPLKVGEQELKLMQSSMHRAEKESPRAGKKPPGSEEAADLPRAEDDRSSEIVVPKPNAVVGLPAPDFKVEDANGKIWRLSDLQQKKNVLLTFFPRCFTGGCANHLSSLRDRQAEFDAADTQILAVSVDPAEGPRGQIAFAKQWQLAFPLITDTQRSLSKLYGAVRNDNQLAARMTILIDKEGVVRFVDTSVNVQKHGDDMLAVMRKIGMIR